MEKEMIKNEFKSKFELNDEEIKKLPKLRIKLSRTKTKKGNVFYTCTTKFNEYKYIQSRIEDKKYNIALLENNIKLDRDEYVKDCYVRFSKGFSSKTDRQFYIYDIFVSNTIRLSFFLDDLDLKEMELMKIKIDFIERGTLEDIDSDFYNNEF